MNSKNWIFILLLGLIWSSSFIFIELMLEVMSPLMLVFFRLIFGAVTLIVYCYFKKVKIPMEPKLWKHMFFISVLSNIGPFSLIAYGQQTISAGLSGQLNSSTAFFTVIIVALFIPQEKVSFNRIIGTIVGIVGVIITIGYEHIFEFTESSFGQYLVLLAGLSYAIGGIWTRIFIKDVSSTASTAVMLISSAVIITPLCFALGEFNDFDFQVFTPTIILYTLAFSIIGTGVAYLLYFKILQNAGVTNVMLVTIIIPPMTVILDALILLQFITLNQWIGLLIIITGLIILDGRIFKNKLQKLPSKG